MASKYKDNCVLDEMVIECNLDVPVVGYFAIKTIVKNDQKNSLRTLLLLVSQYHVTERLWHFTHVQ